MKLFKLKFTSFLLILAFVIGGISTVAFALKTEAASQTAGDLTIEYPGSGALFNASNIAPGYEEVKTITVTNTGTVNHTFSIALTEANGTLATALRFEPRNFDTKVPYWNHTLREIADDSDGFLVLSAITPGQTVKIDLAAILPASTGNEYQATQVETFGIIFGFDSTYNIVPIIVFDNPPDGSGGGTTSGGTLSTSGTSGSGTPVTPRLSRTTGIGGVTPSPSGETVTPSTTTPGGNELGEKETASEDQVKGASTEGEIVCFWWWILLIIFAIFLIIYGMIARKNKIYLSWLWPVVGGLILVVAHEIFHRYYFPSKYCDYFVWSELLMLIPYYAIITAFDGRKSTADESDRKSNKSK